MDLSTFPPELLLIITSYLTHSDLRPLSCASKFLRSICLPTLFNAVYVDTDTHLAFGPGGGLHHIRHHVRHVSLDPGQKISIPHDKENRMVGEMEKTVNYLRICAGGMDVFPGLQSFLVVCRSMEGKYGTCVRVEGFQRRLFKAVFDAISELRVQSRNGKPQGVLDAVKDFEFTYIDEGGLGEIPENQMVDWDYQHLSDDNRRFLGCDEQETNEEIPSHGIYPQGLSVTEAQINFLTLAKFPAPGNYFNPFWTLQGSVQTLRKLVLCGEFGSRARQQLTEATGAGAGTVEKPVLFSLPASVVFPQLVELYVTRQCMIPMFFAELCWRCPNVQMLKIIMGEGELSEMSVEDLEEIYEAMKGMKSLVYAIVPGPSLILEEDLKPQDLVDMWERTLEDWVEAGLWQLSDVAFVMRGKEKDETGSYVSGVGITVIKDCGSRGEESAGFKLQYRKELHDVTQTGCIGIW